MGKQPIHRARSEGFGDENSSSENRHDVDARTGLWKINVQARAGNQSKPTLTHRSERSGFGAISFRSFASRLSAFGSLAKA